MTPICSPQPVIRKTVFMNIDKRSLIINTVFCPQRPSQFHTSAHKGCWGKREIGAFHDAFENNSQIVLHSQARRCKKRVERTAWKRSQNSRVQACWRCSQTVCVCVCTFNLECRIHVSSYTTEQIPPCSESGWWKSRYICIWQHFAQACAAPGSLDVLEIQPADIATFITLLTICFENNSESSHTQYLGTGAHHRHCSWSTTLLQSTNLYSNGS